MGRGHVKPGSRDGGVQVRGAFTRPVTLAANARPLRAQPAHGPARGLGGWPWGHGAAPGLLLHPARRWRVLWAPGLLSPRVQERRPQPPPLPRLLSPRAVTWPVGSRRAPHLAQVSSSRGPRDPPPSPASLAEFCSLPLSARVASLQVGQDLLTHWEGGGRWPCRLRGAWVIRDIVLFPETTLSSWPGGVPGRVCGLALRCVCMVGEGRGDRDGDGRTSCCSSPDR